MKRRLFEDLVVSQEGGHPTKRAYAFPVSVAIHAVAASAVLMIPVFTSEALPDPPPGVLVFPTQVVAGPRGGGGGTPQPPPRPRSRRLPPPSSQAPPLAEQAPMTIIDTVEPSGSPGPAIDDGLPCLADCLGEGPAGPSNGVGDIGSGGDGPITTVRPGGSIKPPTKLRDVSPIYPELAKRVGVEGVVIIECTINPQGRVVNARVLRGHALLDPAAVAAVERWVYTPTLLNGVPVSVVMTVTVKFFLRH